MIESSKIIFMQLLQRLPYETSSTIASLLFLLSLHLLIDSQQQKALRLASSIFFIIISTLWIKVYFRQNNNQNSKERSHLVQLLGLPATGPYDPSCIEQHDVDWNDVKLRLVSHPQEAKEKEGYFTTLTIALLNQRNPIPADVVALLVKLNRQALDLTTLVSTTSSNPYLRQETVAYLLSSDTIAFTKENLQLSQLIYYVSKYGSLGAVKAVVERFPELLFEYSTGGVQSLPLHIACEYQHEEIVKYLLEEDLKSATCNTDATTKEEAAGDINLDSFVLMQSNGYGRTPLDIAIEGFQERNDCIVAYRCLTMCLQAIDSLRSNYTCTFHDIPIIHASIGLVPLKIQEEIINREGMTDGCDEFGNNVFNKAILVATTARWRVFDWTSLLGLLLEHDEHIAKKKNLEGRYPIHIAASRGLKWREGLEKIVLADYDLSLRERDNITNLSTFMLSAENCSDLSTTYRLLREHPVIDE